MLQKLMIETIMSTEYFVKAVKESGAQCRLYPTTAFKRTDNPVFTTLLFNSLS